MRAAPASQARPSPAPPQMPATQPAAATRPQAPAPTRTRLTALRATTTTPAPRQINALLALVRAIIPLSAQRPTPVTSWVRAAQPAAPVPAQLLPMACLL